MLCVTLFCGHIYFLLINPQIPQIPYNCKVIFYGIDISTFYLLISWSTFNLFATSAIIHNPVINIYIQVFIWAYVFISSGKAMRVCLSHMEIICLILKKTTILFPKCLNAFYFTKNSRIFSALHNLQHMPL